METKEHSPCNFRQRWKKARNTGPWDEELQMRPGCPQVSAANEVGLSTGQLCPVQVTVALLPEWQEVGPENWGSTL